MAVWRSAGQTDSSCRRSSPAGIRSTSQQTYSYFCRGLTLLPIPSASLVQLLLRPSQRLWGEQRSPRRGAFFALCFLPVCAAPPADPKSGRSNKGATTTAAIPLARRPHQLDKTVVNKSSRDQNRRLIIQIRGQ